MDRLSLVFAPRFADGTVTDMRVSASLSKAPDAEPCLRYARRTVGIPFADFSGLTLSDDAGGVPFEAREMPAERSFVEETGIFAARPIQGALRWTYTVAPRVLPEGYRSSPYFDFRAEPGGVNSAGLTFLILPEAGTYDTSVGWDLRGMPDGARGVWSLGTGDVRRETDVETLKFSYYMAGDMRATEQGAFGIYWFGDVPFDIGAAAARVRALFRYMCDFFGDTDPTYRVFIRRDPFEKSGGGTALKRSFMTGYSAETVPRTEDWFCTIAHEMVHNWPHMDDEPAGKGTWYTEGIAEYYSAVLPYRAGIVGAEETARHINGKAKRYLESPLRDMPNMELSKIYWSDRRAQPVPYGRGFVYLSNVEAALARAGRGSIDEIAKRFVKDGEMMQPEHWEQFISERLGAEGVRAFEAMKQGVPVVPDPEGFGGGFEVREVTVEVDGQQVQSYEWRAKA